MTEPARYDVTVIGAGPAGLAAALEADRSGASVLLVEREARLGGILKQCIHDGFGLVRFGEKLSGPEYADRFIHELKTSRVNVSTLSFVSEAVHTDSGTRLTLITREGVKQVVARALVLATGCRERTSRQIGVHGRHCAGVFTAGSAQYYTNILGMLPTRRCVILGSGDIGLIMARRLTLEGAKVLGVYEAKPTPSGLSRNISQCLTDFDIPLHTSVTVTRVFGEQRLREVELADVDERMRPLPGTERRASCDALILSVGLIPENELAGSLGVPLDPKTKGPYVDERSQTLLPGIYACGNALHVSDLVDYVSESGETAGRAASRPGAPSRALSEVNCDASILYVVPQRLDRNAAEAERIFYFRSAAELENAVLTVRCGETTLLTKGYAHIRPPEMERLSLPVPAEALSCGEPVTFSLEVRPE